MKQNEFRIFLSSTFNDLQPEREQLVKKVFPQIRALCRERGVEFTEIDLRWGITEEEARSGKVIRICLEEIDKCRPYFLCILGSRYGWRPQISDIEKDEELLAIYPWLREFVGNNKSIVELEVTYGALQSEQEGSSFFYESASAIENISEADKAPYDKLKQTLQAAGLLDHKFNTPEELGEKVLHDLTAILDRDWPAKKEMTPAERERTPHEAFAFNRTRSYIANPEYYERFEEFVDRDSGTDFSPSERTEVRSTESRPLILWGKSGFGKSALMSHLTSEYKKRHPDAFVVRHFVGATAGGCSSDDVIRHIMLEIKERYELSDELPQSNLQDEFSVWLAKIKEGEKLILAIDAVNQLTGIGPEMHWLPEFIPHGVRLIVSTTPEVPLEQLRKRNWQELEMLPLTSQQKSRIAKEFLARYHKRLPDELLEIIGSEAKLESPLFLRTVLEELRIFGVHEAIDMHLASYLASENESELFQTVLARMERDHGKSAVQSVMSAIWASRFGLSETELMEITGLSRLALSEFLIALEFHLMQRTELYTFFHNYLREAVETRYLSEENAEKEAHRRLAAYFSEEPYDTRRRDEEPWQWQQSENSEALQECLVCPQMVAMFVTDQEVYEAYSLWKSLPEIAFDETYIQRLQSERIPDRMKFSAFKNIINLFITAGKFDNAAVILSEGQPYFEKILTIENLRECYEKRASIEYYRNNFDSAIEQTNTLLESVNDDSGSTKLQLRLLDLLSSSYYQIGKFNEAEQIARNQIELAKDLHGYNSQEIAIKYNNLATFLMGAGKYSESEEMFTKALLIFTTLLGTQHPETAMSRFNLGACFFHQRRFEDAMREFKSAEEGLLTSLGPDHKQTLICENNIANLLAELGRIDEARSLALDILVRLVHSLGEDDLYTAYMGIFVGYTYYLQKEYSRAKPYYEKYLPVRTRIQGELHPEVLRYKARLAEINDALERAALPH